MSGLADFAADSFGGDYRIRIESFAFIGTASSANPTVYKCFLEGDAQGFDAGMLAALYHWGEDLSP